MKVKTIAIGSDHGAFALKSELIPVLEKWDYEVIDCGSFNGEAVDYPDIAEATCARVLSGEADRAIVMCGTGIGVSMVANKIDGIRCALCSEGYSARMTREHNDTNVLAMGGRTVGPELAIDIMRIWLETEFDGAERNVRRIGKLMAIQEK